jgi:hypothetical protein
MEIAVRRRLCAAGLLVATLALGVTTRRVPLGALLWDKSAGDALYAVAAYLGIAFVLPRAAPLVVALLALSYCTGVELLQLTGISAALIERWRPAHWILGSTFAWHDLACYGAGIALAFFIHRRALQ